MATKLYTAGNWHMVTTSPPTKISTGASTLTLMQLKAGAIPIRIKEWGISFDGDTAATPGICELIDTGTIGATVTAFVTADVQPYNDPNAPASTLTLATSGSGFTSSAEGSITATKSFDSQLIAPSGQYVKQFVLGDEPETAAGHIVRVRVTFAATVNALCYVIWEE